MEHAKCTGIHNYCGRVKMTAAGFHEGPPHVAAKGIKRQKKQEQEVLTRSNKLQLRQLVSNDARTRLFVSCFLFVCVLLLVCLFVGSFVYLVLVSLLFGSVGYWYY